MDNHPMGWPLLYEVPLGMFCLYGKVMVFTLLSSFSFKTLIVSLKMHSTFPEQTSQVVPLLDHLRHLDEAAYSLQYDLRLEHGSDFRFGMKVPPRSLQFSPHPLGHRLPQPCNSDREPTTVAT